MLTGCIQYQSTFFPESNLYFCVAAFSNGIGHLAKFRRIKQVARRRWFQVNFQQRLPLGQTDMLFTGYKNPRTIVCGKTIVLTIQYDCADAAPEPNAIEGNPGNGHHNGAGEGKSAALYPLVGTGKRRAAVFFNISHASIKMVHLPIQAKGAV